MSKRIGRNNACWCGSGKKYKHCHLRLRSDDWRRLEVEKLIRSSYSKRYCLHPEATDSNCQGGISSAHSVSRSVLKQLARNGHVYGIAHDDVASIRSHKGRLVPQLIGVNKASAFTGFCNHHDNATFSPIDDCVFSGASEEVFLISYRSLCREVFDKKAAVASHSDSRKLLEYYPPSRIPYLANLNLEQYLAHSTGLQKLVKQKELYDGMLLARSHGELRYIAILFEGAPRVVCAGVFNPQYDFSGRFIQNITTSRWEDCALIAYSLVPAKLGFAAVFSWIKEYDDKCLPFVESYLERGAAELPSLSIVLAFQHVGNLYISPGWWEGIESDLRESLVSHFQVGLSIERSSESLLNLDRKYLDCSIDEVIASRGLRSASTEESSDD